MEAKWRHGGAALPLFADLLAVFWHVSYVFICIFDVASEDAIRP